MSQGNNVFQFPQKVNLEEFFRNSGWVYVLGNGFMPEVFKIGRTTGHVEDRMRQLFTSGVPMPFDCMFAEWFCDCRAAEKFIHQYLDGYRVELNREFFGADLDVIEEAFMTYSAAIEDIPESVESIYSTRRKQAESQEKVNGVLVSRGAKKSFSMGVPF